MELSLLQRYDFCDISSFSLHILLVLLLIPSSSPPAHSLFLSLFSFFLSIF